MTDQMLDPKMVRSDSSDAFSTSQTKHQEHSHKDEMLTASQPKIVLETLSAKSTLRVLMIIFLSAGGFFGLDSYLTYTTFSGAHDRTQPLHNCTADHLATINSGKTQNYMGCLSTNNADMGIYYGIYGHYVNILSLSLKLVSTEPTIAPPSSAVTYDIKLMGCSVNTGCGELIGGDMADSWHEVLDLKQQTHNWVPMENQDYQHGLPVEWGLEFAHILQNQEALPSNGYVRSYLVEVTVYGDPAFRDPKNSVLFSVSENPRGFLTYFFDLLTMMLMTATLCIMYYYFLNVEEYTTKFESDGETKKWLPEQYWVFSYLFILFLYQNPFHIGANIGESSPSGALLSYIFSNFGRTGFMVLWLCMADSMSYDDSSWRALIRFYAPKVIFGVLLFIPVCVVLAYQFPTFRDHSKDESSMLAVAMWPKSDREAFIIFSIMFLFLFWLWALIWFGTLYNTYKKLSHMPYISSRYQQLLFRFYMLEMSLVTIYLVAQYGVAAHYIGEFTTISTENEVEVTDNINTMFKQQTDQYGKTFFLTIVGYLLAFVTLPSGYILSGDNLTIMASIFAISEEERDELMAMRVESMKKTNIPGKKDRELERGDHIFCLDHALLLLQASYESYVECPSTDQDDIEIALEIAEEKLAPFGYKCVDIVVLPDKDLQCLICRHVPSSRLVVAFRGTVSMDNMKMNFDRELVPYELALWGMPELDKVDGLDETFDSIPGGDRKSKKMGQSSFASTWKDMMSNMSAGLGGVGRRPSADASVAAAAGGGSGGAAGADRCKSVSRLNLRSNNNRASSKFSPAALAAPASPSRSLYDVTDDGDNNNRYSTRDSESNRSSRLEERRSRSDSRNSRDHLDTEKYVSEEESRSQKNTPKAAAVPLEFAERALDITGNLMLMALHNTPGLSSLAVPRVHTGFLGSYNALRDDINRIVRRELKECPGEVCVTGHSLGGALATLCAMDVSVHTLPRVRAYYRRKEAVEKTSRGISTSLKMVMYTFGQPRVGDIVFRSVYDTLCPESFRVVVEGDVVTSVPKNSAGYRHAGTSVLTDSKDVGNIIVDPSFVERFFRTKKVYLGVSVHLLDNYRECLLAVKRAAGATGVSVAPEKLEAQRQIRASSMTRQSARSREWREGDGDVENGGGGGVPETAMQRILRQSVHRMSQNVDAAGAGGGGGATLSPMGSSKVLASAAATRYNNEL